MPKFSAYMRGEEGPQGDVGQAVLLNGIVSSSSELPPNTQNQKNLVYYVGDEQEGYHLYVYTTTEGQWQNLGSIKGQKGDTGPAAGFAINQNYEIFAVDPDAEPQISIIPDPNSPDTSKVFNFTFGLPRGQNAGFNQNQNIEIENVDNIEQMYASVSTDENSPNTAKIFNFKFGIPRGEAADFGEPTASISTISSLSTASVSITSSGSATSKIFDFHFDIPQGQKGDRGDSFSIYEPVAFTTGSEYWVNTTTLVYPRGDNSKLPIYIYNEDTNSLYNSSFIYTTTEIIYHSEQPFNGTLYLMAGANRPTINIGEVSTTSFDGQMSASLNERSTSSDAIIDFILARGPHGEPGGFGEVTSTAELIPSSSTYVEKDSIVSFSTDYDINDVTVDIEPIQEGSGDPSPENMRPILGWTGVNIYVSPTLSTEDATVYPVSWSTQAGTVYGGSLNVMTGVLTVDKAYLEFDGSEDESWNITNTGTENWYYNYFTNISAKSASIVIAQSLCNTYQINQIANNNTLKGAYITTDGKFRVRLNTEDTVENWKSYLNNNHLQFVFPLAEPITYQLTPTQITALLGQNNIWADTGDVQVSYNKFNQPYVEITTDEDSPNTAKRFNFHFGIPQGEKGAPGDAFAIYEPLSFTTGSSYWMGNTLVVPRGDNNKLPLFIYNRDNNNIAATFKLENNYIRHDADSPFNGTLYMMSQTNRSTLRIGNVSTTTYGNGSSFMLNPESTSTDAIFDVVLEQGPRGETALSAQVGRVSYTSGIPNVEIEGEQNLVFNFDLPRGFKGEKGDTFTVDVDETIDILGYNEIPVVETTSTSTGIALKFKLPPSVSAQLGDLSQLNTISITSNYITGILPVNKGGTGVNQLTTNAIILGNNTTIKQKATSAGAFYANGNNAEPGFGTLPITYGGTGRTTFTTNAVLLGNGTTALKTKTVANGAFFATSANDEPNFGTLPIAQGGTGTTTAAAAWTALGGGASGKHPDSYFALANHGTHVSYGTTVTAIGTASAGSASTVSRSDHVHNINVATGDNNGQVKIAGQNVAVKGLKSAAFTESSAYAAASHTHNYAGSSSAGGAANSLVNFTVNKNSGQNANNVIYAAHTYYTSNGPSTSIGASVNDGALYSQAYSDNWVAQIAQDYRNGNLFTRGRNNGTWSAWKAVSYGNYVLDSGNNTKITFQYSGSGISNAGWYCVWNGYSIGAMSIANLRNNLYSYGTTELEPGVSNLETGKLYFVYE